MGGLAAWEAWASQIEVDDAAPAHCLTAIHDMMWEIWGLMGEWGSPDAYLEFAKPKVRRAMAGVLRRAAAKDCEAAELIRRALLALW